MTFMRDVMRSYRPLDKEQTSRSNSWYACFVFRRSPVRFWSGGRVSQAKFSSWKMRGCLKL